MSAKKCPLCGGKLKGSYCESCGYDVPEDDDLSMVYDMDPENDAFGEQVREIIPEVQMEEIYPNREPPKFKVRDEDGKTVRRNYQSPPPSPPPYAGGGNYGNYGGQAQQAQQAQQGNPPPSPYANNGGNYVPPPSPYANGGPQSGQQTFAEEIKEFAQKYWWVWLLMFLLPWWLCVIAFTTLCQNSSVIFQKYKRVLVLSFVAALILPPW
ncbi:MAG: hypothetical protein NC395_08925 [Prevotella sp.]|nr:hypothetical protein [Prevotella sp.]